MRLDALLNLEPFLCIDKPEWAIWLCCFFLTVYGDSQPLDKVFLNISQSHMAHLGHQLQGIVSLNPRLLPVLPGFP